MSQNKIIIYQTQDGKTTIDVKLEQDTVWLTQAQMAELFQKDRTVIGRHINNVYKEGELPRDTTCAKFAHVGMDADQTYETAIYNLDVVISVGYRVKSQRGTQFRIWANQILKEYLLKGYTINQRIELLEQRMNFKFSEYDEKFDFFIKTSLPPVEGVFYDGQLFDAYKFVADLIRTATTSLILIDNYIDDTVLTLFTKRIPGIKVTIYTAQISKQLSLDLQRHNSQYEPIDIRQFNQSHDRFLIIDEKELYHIGASLKDLGKKWFAFSKIQLDIRELLSHL